jgi:alkyldihydroxyacetonephosphate synthase
VATLGPGLRGPEAEALLSARGYTLGHFPQSFQYATIGGFAAARSSGQASAGYGRFDERVVGLELVTPRGRLRCGLAPRAATGPDLRQLVLGSEGAFGVITAVRVEIAPVPAVRVYEGWRLPSFTAGCEALRALAQDGPRPTVMRLCDEVETALNLAAPDAIGADGARGGCLAIAGYEGTAEETAHRRRCAGAVYERLGGVAEPAAGAAWAEGRFAAPYLRDALLDAGALVETLETAAFWSAVPALYTAVRDALTRSLTEVGAPPLVLAHVSHVYASGASLYFTVACAQGEDPLARWAHAKAAACEAILAVGGAITHHHGIGTDHRPYFERQTGELGIAALRAVKRALDPEGIMNPGVLLP